MSMAAVGAADYARAIDGLNLSQAKLLLTLQGVDAEQQESLLLQAGLISSSDQMQARHVAQALSTTALGEAEKNRILTKLGLIDAETGEILTSQTCTKEKLLQALATTTLDETEKEELVTKILGTSGNVKYALSFKVLAGAIWDSIKAMAKWLVTTPTGWATIAIGAIVGVTAAVVNYNKKLEETRQKHIEVGQSAKEETEQLKSLVEQYKEAASSGVWDDNKRSQAKDIQKQITELVGAQADNLYLVNGELDNEIDKLNKLLTLQAKTKKADFLVALDDAEESLHYNSKNTIATNIFGNKDVIKKLSDNIEGFKTQGGSGESNVLGLSTLYNTSTTDGLLQYYDNLIKAKNTLVEIYGKEVAENENVKRVYEQIQTKIDALTESVDKYKQALSNWNVNEAVIVFNEGFSAVDYPQLSKELNGFKAATIDTEEEIKSWANAILNSTELSEDLKKEIITLTGTSLPQFKDTLYATTRQFYGLNDAGTDVNSKLTVSKSRLDDMITNLSATASECGLTTSAMAQMILKLINLNNTKLNLSQQIAEIMKLRGAMGLETSKLTSQDIYNYGVKYKIGTTGKGGYSYKGKWYNSYNDMYYAVLNDMTNEEIIDITGGGSSGGGSSGGGSSGGGSSGGGSSKDSGSNKSSKDKTPFDDSYYSTVNAWIDENQKEIERFEKDREALNRQFENALDTGNKEQAEILRSKLAENAKMQKDILHQQNEAHRITQGQLLQSLYQYAPSLSGKSWDEISEVDLTNIENTLSKTSEMATDDNAKNRAKKDLNYFKGIVDDLKAINDAMESNSEDWWSKDEEIKGYWTSQIDLQNEYFEENLSNRKAFNKLSKKEEVVAYSQAIADNKRYQEQILNDTTLSENAKLALIKEIDDTIIEYEKEIYDLRTDMIDELFDIRIERLNSQASLLKAHYDLVNSIAEEQHSLNKELLEAETVGARMSEHERQSLFSKEEYTKLSKKLNEVLKDADEIQSNYIADLKSATKDTISQITNEYERQYELKEKEYNIVKAELSLAKAQEELENAKNEKTQKVWNGSKWVYDSSIQDVIDAANNLEDAKYELLKAQTEQTQQQAIGSLESESDLLQTKQNQLAEAFGGLAEETNASKALLTEALQSIANVDIPTFENIIGIIGDDLLNLFGISGGTVNQIKWSSPLYQNNIAPVGYKSGGKNVPKGIARFDEDGLGSELIIDKDGVLTQFNAGDTIFSKEMVDKLWDMLSSNTFVPSFTPNVKIPDMTQIVNNNTPQDNRSFSVNGITVEDYKGKELLKQVAQYFCRM